MALILYECLINPTTPKWCENYLIYNQINYKDMEIVINGNNHQGKDTYGTKANIRYLPYNKISNIIYMVNYNLLLNIFNMLSHKRKSCFIMGTLRLCKRCVSQRNLETVMARARFSDSQLKHEIVSCFLALQEARLLPR